MVLASTTEYGGCNKIWRGGDLCNMFAYLQYKGYIINKIHLVLGFLNKFHHNVLGIDYPHHYIIYLMDC
jgi:hypothetical protein